MNPIRRRGLRESLQQYAKRLNVSVEQARHAWRLQGLESLGVHTTSDDPFLVSHVRVAPGVAVPCGLEPKDVIVTEETEARRAALIADMRDDPRYCF